MVHKLVTPKVSDYSNKLRSVWYGNSKGTSVLTLNQSLFFTKIGVCLFFFFNGVCFFFFENRSLFFLKIRVYFFENRGLIFGNRSLYFLKIGVCSEKNRSCFWKIRVCSFQYWSLFFENPSIGPRFCAVIRNI